ncbi:hypothetical protein C9419_01515 [Paraburkholderia fungorum]|nr:hypothetical protein C9419_01515 [Paraburkholderia fungorum]
MLLVRYFGFALLVVCSGVGLLVFPCFVCGLFGFGVGLLAFPCFLIGLLALPLCGAALTFFAAAKKVSKESGSNR